jgi:hypothetical protein
MRLREKTEEEDKSQLLLLPGLTNKAKKWSMALGQVYVCVCLS